MEYFGFFSLGVALAGLGLRGYFSIRAQAVLRAEAQQQHLSPRARRVKQAALARRLLRYHRGLSAA